ncbi:hypothetical protein IAR55_001418 [Kwoniella newhampshirensis]|uniref:Uncharacterized protein n=1 Tax=Kwoniella newhampshirensis TaxID=1651941 RepID=A0AAW0Z266_9TREE
MDSNTTNQPSGGSTSRSAQEMHDAYPAGWGQPRGEAPWKMLSKRQSTATYPPTIGSVTLLPLSNSPKMSFADQAGESTIATGEDQSAQPDRMQQVDCHDVGSTIAESTSTRDLEMAGTLDHSTRESKKRRRRRWESDADLKPPPIDPQTEEAWKRPAPTLTWLTPVVQDEETTPGADTSGNRKGKEPARD